MKAHPLKPVILAVSDDTEGMKRIERELHARYEADYRVVCEGCRVVYLCHWRRACPASSPSAT